MKSQKIKYGVCVANDDPYNAGRIRVLIDSEYRRNFIDNNYAKAIIDEVDSQNEGKYIKWELATNRYINDPYLVNPLLPKHLSIVPKVGESVKLILFEDGSNSYMEYLGPDISNLNKTNFELYEEGRGFTDKRLKNPPRLNFDEYIYPKVGEVSVIGRDNSEMILSNKSIFLRSGFRTIDGLRKSDNFGMIQIQKFPTKKINRKQKQTIDKTPKAIIDYIVEMDINTVGDDITTKLIVYPTSDILNTKNYNESNIYLENNLDIVLDIEITGKDVRKLANFINNILLGLDVNKFKLNTFETTQINDLSYFVNDYRPPINGEVQEGTNNFNMSLYAFRFNPTQNIEDSGYLSLSNLFVNELRPLNKVPATVTEVVEVDVLEDLENTEQSVIFNLSDIQFLLSSETDPILPNQISKYGFTQERLNNYLLTNTEPMVRGRKLAKILLRILDIIDDHGHSTDGPDTISENVKEELKSLKEELSSILNEDINNSSNLVNEYLRIN